MTSTTLLSVQDVQAAASKPTWDDFPDLSKIKFPKSWEQVQEQMDPFTIIISILVIWCIICILCNILRCLLNFFCCCFCNNNNGPSYRVISRRRGYTPIMEEAPQRCHHDNNPPPYNPAYKASVYGNNASPSTSYGDDSTCRNMLWGLCCFEWCCRDSKDVDCCNLCCCMCLYEVCCPRQKPNNNMVMVV